MRFTFGSRVACAAAMLFAAAPFAAAAPLPVAPAEAPPITGVVTDTAGVPLSNARVTLSGANRATTTGANGTFILRAVPPGTHHIDVTRIGYAPEHVEVTVPEDGPPVEVVVRLTPSPLALEGVLVTGTPGASDPLTVSQSTTQISGKELDRQLGATVGETLASEPGISVRYAGPAASTPVIRGLSGDRVLVLQNGQRTGDLSGASADHALSVDPLSATRMEVVRGPASLLYGSSALGGVINVISTDIPTNVPAEAAGYAAAQAETATPGGAVSAEITIPVGSPLALLVRGGARRASDLRVGGSGILENTSIENVHADVGLGYVGETLAGGAAYSLYDFEYGVPFGHGHEHHTDEPGVPGGADGEEEDAGIDIDGRRQALSARASWAPQRTSAVTELNISGSAQWYTHDEIEPGGEVGTTFELNTQTLDLRANTDFWNVRGTVGISGLLKQYAPTGEEALTPPANSRSTGLFVYQEMPIFGGGHDTEYVPHVQFGARYDDYSIESQAAGGKFGPARESDFGAFSGSVGVNVPFNREASIGVSIARAFRAPTVEELFSNAVHVATATFDRGDPELEAETNLGLEGIARVQNRTVNAQFSAYYNRIDGYITPQLVGDTLLIDHGEEVVLPVNEYTQEDAALRGVEGKIEVLVTEALVVGARGDIVRGEFRKDGSPLPFMPAGHLGGNVRWDNGSLSAGLDVRHAFRQDEVPAHELATDSYTLLGANLAYTVSAGALVHTFTLKAANLLDEPYREATSRIKEFALNPGRNVSLVYRVLF